MDTTNPFVRVIDGETWLSESAVQKAVADERARCVAILEQIIPRALDAASNQAERDLVEIARQCIDHVLPLVREGFDPR